MNSTSKLAVLGGGGETARSLPTALRPDPTAFFTAQEHLQLALTSLLEAQGYRGDETMGQLVDAWLASCSRLTETTRNGYKTNAAAFCRALAGLREGALHTVRAAAELEQLGRALPIASVTLADVERAIDRMAAGRWNSVTTSLRAAFAWANRHGFAGVGMLRPAARRHRPRPVVLPKGAWARAAHLLYDHFEAARPRSRSTAAAALCSVRWGVRRGAVARLEWGQVLGGELRVNDKGRPRIVILDELDQEILAMLGSGLPEAERGRWVFRGRSGGRGHVDPGSVSKHARRVLRPAGLELTLHQAGRHAAGATILELGGSTGDAATHLGHANDRVTRERYLPAVTDATRARALLREAYDQAAARGSATNTSARVAR